ncbi:hypothetical protein BDZ89DRAFT_1192413 [Hymenopellis radicata]|nr:hypothetical protein BDZ89DRAFT_1192413 [Hymenopellis radicata]
MPPPFGARNHLRSILGPPDRYWVSVLSLFRLAAVNDPFNYEQKYSPDAEYEKLFPKARVWRVYGDKSVKYDLEMVGGWREGLDILLVLAALFSAVVTTFVTQTCQALRVNHGEVTASLMLELIADQRAMVMGREAVENVPQHFRIPTLFSRRPQNGGTGCGSLAWG